MDAISDRAFTEVQAVDLPSEEPSLLTIILDLSPKGWYNLKDTITIQEITKSLLVFLNSHLALNNSNLVAFITSSPDGSKFLYPKPEKNYDERLIHHNTDLAGHVSSREGTPSLVNRGMYRQFRMVDEVVLQELNEELNDLCAFIDGGKFEKATSTLSGALSMALTYTNRLLNLDSSISTTTASAISSSTNTSATAGLSGSAASAGTALSSGSNLSSSSMKSRILVVSASDEDDIKYISVMNAIFAAQRMKVSIDVAKLGHKSSSYLQQASDATNGVYLNIQNPQGLMQTLATAYFIEPAIRLMIILPTNTNVNYRASCFITGKAVDLGYVCSVCLCIMSIIPEDGVCPTCQSSFDDKVLAQLRRKPGVSARKKRKVDQNGDTPST